MMYETLSFDCHHDSILSRGYQYRDNPVTEESEAGEEHPLAPVLVAAPGVLVVLRQVPAQRRHLPRHLPRHLLHLQHSQVAAITHHRS